MANRLSWGRITLRVPPELHQQMADIAYHLGLDLTGLINLMIREGLPSYREKAAGLRARNQEIDDALGMRPGGNMEMRPPGTIPRQQTTVHLPIPTEPAKGKKGGRK